MTVETDALKLLADTFRHSLENGKQPTFSAGDLKFYIGVLDKLAALPALTVWEGPMPESNGKSNFTAILMRKDVPFMDGITSGITFDRSEYPGRVRYEADRMRFLIGELAEGPDILAYDTDKHSGYGRNVDCGECPNITDGCQGTCQKAKP